MFAVRRSLSWSVMLPALLFAGSVQGGELPGERIAHADDAVAPPITAPVTDGFRNLHAALLQYLELQARGGWPEFPAGTILRPGAEDPRVPLLRDRLVLSGDLAPDSTTGYPTEAGPSNRYDDALAGAVRRFQARHGLDVDGQVGPLTRAALNIPVERRIGQLLVNLERWRRMPADDGERRLIVNIPDFRAELRAHGETLATTRVIVGRANRPTPELSTRITHLVVNPTWTVPERIARLDLLPKLRNDPDYLDRGGFRVLAGWNPDARILDPDTIDWHDIAGRFPFVLRQAPGPANALGSLKFEMPNPYSVYLHDTPDRHLFDNAARAFSAGCIRVEGILDLAGALAEPSGWDRPRLEAQIRVGQTRHLRLANPVEVHLVYLTAWVGEAGSVEFRDDIYGKDQDLLMRL
jgi:L,D-transpeptidase YcbB